MPPDKKRRRENEAPREISTAKPTAVFRPTGGRPHTLSIALPGSIVANAKSHDQKTLLAGQLARALAVFSVDEIVIFDDEDLSTQQTRPPIRDHDYTALSHPHHFLAHLLSYLETPPHMRKTLFPMHPNLRTAGTLPSLDMPHHLRAHEWCEYREGVSVEASPDGSGTTVDVGLAEPLTVPDLQIPPYSRVTVRLRNRNTTSAEAVAPTAPREERGYYWGYTVRQCGSLSDVFTECPFDGGYDLSIGTSERGQPLADVLAQDHLTAPASPGFQHILVVFGGVAGLEVAAKNDPTFAPMGLTGDRTGEVFDCWVNVLPGQGSRTIRTEEAVWLGLMGLRGFTQRLGKELVPEP